MRSDSHVRHRGWCLGSSFPRQVWAFLDLVVPVGLAAFVYAGHRQRLSALGALQALETQRTETMGRLSACRLEAARARVNPEAFIDELHALRRTYLVDAAAGVASLDALITRLRTASRSVAR